MREELKTRQKQNTAVSRNLNFGFNIPTYTASGPAAQVPSKEPSALTTSPTPPNVPPNAAPLDKKGDFQNRDLLANGKKWNVDESWSPQEYYEQEYGELGGELAGVTHFIQDWNKNVLKPHIAKNKELRQKIQKRNQQRELLQKTTRKHNTKTAYDVWLRKHYSDQQPYIKPW